MNFFTVIYLFLIALSIIVSESEKTVPEVDHDVLSAEQSSVEVGYKLSVFILPPRYQGPPTEFQHKTIRSLIYLVPRPKVFLLGNHPSFHELAVQYKRWNVKRELMVDKNFLGTPLFSSVFSRALATGSEISVILNGDITFINAPALKNLLDSIYASSKRFLVLSPLLEVKNLPPKLTSKPSARGRKKADDIFHSFVLNTGRIQIHGGAGAYLWDNDLLSPFYNGSMPPFPSRKADFDTWLSHNVLKTTDRAVVEAGRALVCVAVADIGNYFENRENTESWKLAAGKDPWNVGAQRNTFLETESESGDSSCATRTPKIARICEKGKGTCLRDVSCPCNEQLDVGGRAEWLCNAIAPKPYVDAIVAHRPVRVSTLRSVEDLLPIVADDNKIVVLVAVSGRYANMLMNFVCNLRRLKLRDPLVAALDSRLYRFANAQGLPVYLERPSEEFKQKFKAQNHLEVKCVYGSVCFKQLTKLKSRAVLKILKLGYHVLWSDVDIFWLRNPLPEMISPGPGTFPVQCDEWNTTIPPSGLGFPVSVDFGTINSGFYFARSEDKVIEAFEAIIDHAAQRLNQSEQPSFYKVLCGEQQEYVTSETECVWKNGLKVVFLPRELHPNGRVFFIWRAKTLSRCKEMGCASIHNNWIKGMDKKTMRFKRKNLWFWDEYTRLCRYEWYSKSAGLIKAHWKYGAERLVVPGAVESIK